MVDQRVTARDLGFLRLAVFGMWLIKVAADPFERLAVMPPGIWEPIGPIGLLPEAWRPILWSAPSLITLKIALLVTLFASAAGLRSYRYWAVAAAALLTLQQSVIRGLGDVNHSEIGPLLVVYVLAVSPAAAGLAWRRKAPGARSPSDAACTAVVRGMGLCLLLPYCMIAAYRRTHAGVAIFEPQVMASWMTRLSLRPTYFGSELGLWAAANPGVMALLAGGFFFVSMLELLAPLCLASRRFRVVWVLVMAPFHLSTLFLMNILFWENTLLIVLLLTPVVSWVLPRAVAAGPTWEGLTDDRIDPSALSSTHAV